MTSQLAITRSIARSIPPCALPLALLVAVSASACADSLPPEEKVIEHRLLAAPVHVIAPHDPEQVPDGFIRADALPGETVEIVPFAVGPDGVVDPAALDLRWIACELYPGRGEFACLAENFPLRLEDLPACDFPTLAELADSQGPTPIVTPCLLGREGTASFAIPASVGVLEGADIELTLIGSTPGGTSTERCAADLLAGKGNLPNDCLYGVQVASVGPKLRLIDWLASLGVDLGDIERPDPASIDEPDLHPHITSFRISVVDEDGNELVAPLEVPLGGEFEVEAGQTLRIDAASPESELQEFRIPVNNGAGFETLTEAYYNEWFITWGSLLSPLSLDADSYNIWTLKAADDDADTPPNGVAHLYYVVTDDRNGATTWWVSLRFS